MFQEFKMFYSLYTKNIENMFGTSQGVFRQSNQGKLWTKIIALTSLLKGTDLVGIYRALGASYFLSDAFESSDFAEFFGTCRL